VDDTGDVPSDCIRVLRVFLQLTNRKYLDDVMAKLGISKLEEYHYDLLEEDETAIDAKKSILFSCWELPRYGICGHLENKGVLFLYFCFII